MVYFSEKRRPKEDLDELDAKNKIAKNMVRFKIMIIDYFRFSVFDIILYTIKKKETGMYFSQ